MWYSKLKPALISGAALGLASGLPFIGSLRTVLYIGAGVLASYLYMKARHASGGTPLAKEPAGAAKGGYGDGGYGDNAVVGLLTGVVCGVVTTLVTSIAAVVSFFIAGDLFEHDPLSEAMLQLARYGINLPKWAAVIVVSAGILILNTIWACILATLGGVLGTAIFRNKFSTA